MMTTNMRGIERRSTFVLPLRPGATPGSSSHHGRPAASSRQPSHRTGEPTMSPSTPLKYVVQQPHSSKDENRQHPKLDRSVIDKLTEDIRRSPPGLEKRKLLMEQYAMRGSFADAERQARMILSFKPSDKEANKFLQRSSLTNDPTHRQQVHSRHETIPQRTGEKGKGKEIQRDRLSLAKEKSSMSATAYDRRGKDAAAIQRGNMATHPVPKPQASARSVARTLRTMSRDSKTKALNAACDDLEDLAGRIRHTSSRDSSNQRREAVREALVKRVAEVKVLLPSDLHWIGELAFMHADHELLYRKYVNQETMYGDKVSDIPRARFWVSEDGYAWDMDELAKAIDANHGVMRNPISKYMFPPSDVRAIVQHPLGKRLAAMGVSQRKLRQGVRPETVEKLGRLSKTLLDDDERTLFVPSRRGVEAFMAYVATLPATEQEAIQKLWVPAVDSHTGWGFDLSIGEALEDALANRVCFHKVGDLLGQAARYLRG